MSEPKVIPAAHTAILPCKKCSAQPILEVTDLGDGYVIRCNCASCGTMSGELEPLIATWNERHGAAPAPAWNQDVIPMIVSEDELVTLCLNAPGLEVGQVFNFILDRIVPLAEGGIGLGFKLVVVGKVKPQAAGMLSQEASRILVPR